MESLVVVTIFRIIERIVVLVVVGKFGRIVRKIISLEMNCSNMNFRSCTNYQSNILKILSKDNKKMDELVEKYIEKHGYNPEIQFGESMTEKELFEHLKKANGRKIVILYDKGFDKIKQIVYK